MNIRKVKIEDYEEVVKLYKELWDAEKIFDLNMKQEYKVSDKQKKIIQKRIKSRKSIFLVAEENKKVVGLIDGYIIEDSNYIEKVGYLDNLCVSKNNRKQGISTKLIEEFIKIMKRKNVSYLKLNAFENNTPAINLYKKLGFEEHSIYYTKKI